MTTANKFSMLIFTSLFVPLLLIQFQLLVAAQVTVHDSLFDRLEDGTKSELIGLINEIAKEGGNLKELLTSGLAKLKSEKASSDLSQHDGDRLFLDAGSYENESQKPLKMQDNKPKSGADQVEALLGDQQAPVPILPNLPTSFKPSTQTDGHVTLNFSNVNETEHNQPAPIAIKTSAPSTSTGNIIDAGVDSGSRSLLDMTSGFLKDRITRLDNLSKLSKELDGITEERQLSLNKLPSAVSIGGLDQTGQASSNVTSSPEPSVATADQGPNQTKQTDPVSDHQSTPEPHTEEYEDSFVDSSDPSDPKLVHVKEKSTTEVGPNGFSREHQETQESTSLGDNPNNYHHSSSSTSFSSSSTSSSSSGSGDSDVLKATPSDVAPNESDQEDVSSRPALTRKHFKISRAQKRKNSQFNHQAFPMMTSLPFMPTTQTFRPIQPLQPLQPMNPWTSSMFQPIVPFNGFPTAWPTNFMAPAFLNFHQMTPGNTGFGTTNPFANTFARTGRDQFESDGADERRAKRKRTD